MLDSQTLFILWRNVCILSQPLLVYPTPKPLATRVLLSVSLSLTLFFFFKISHISSTMQYSSLSGLLHLVNYCWHLMAMWWGWIPLCIRFPLWPVLKRDEGCWTPHLFALPQDDQGATDIVVQKHLNAT